MVVDALFVETYGGSTIAQYVVFFVVLTIGAVTGRILSFILERHLMRRAETTESEIDDIIIRSLGGPIALIGVVVAGYFGRPVLTPTDRAAEILSAAVEVPLVVAGAWMAIRLTDGLIKNYIGDYAEETESKLDDALVPIVSRMTNLAIVSISAIVVLDSIGYDVTAIIASLGIGGIAVAFAARRSLSDLFGGAHILSTKPFLVDDVIEVNDTAGTVEEIGLRSTVLRDFDGRLVTIPNGTIANSPVKNISSQPTWRIKTQVALPHDLTASELEEALGLLEGAVNGVDGIDQSQTGAWFWEYGDSTKLVRLDYHIADLDGWKDVRDRVNREIQAAFEAANLELAVPTRRIRLEDTPDTGPSASPTGVEGSD